MNKIYKLLSTIILFSCLCVSEIVYANNEILLKVEKYFNNLSTLKANFIQIAPDGNISEGMFYLQLPGKLRFDYDKPSNLLITCQGFWVIVQDRNSKQTTNVPLSETPLNFLLKKNIDLHDDKLIISTSESHGLIKISIKQKKNDGGMLTLKFSTSPFELRKWIVKDSFENETSVLIQNIVVGENLSYLLFFPDDF